VWLLNYLQYKRTTGRTAHTKHSLCKSYFIKYTPHEKMFQNLVTDHNDRHGLCHAHILSIMCGFQEI